MVVSETARGALGPALTFGAMCALLRIDASTLRDLVDTDQVLELSANGKRVYLRAQVGDDATVAPGLPDVIAELASGDDDPWEWATWLSARTARRRGRNAFEQLHAGELVVVVADACRAARVWRA